MQQLNPQQVAQLQMMLQGQLQMLMQVQMMQAQGVPGASGAGGVPPAAGEPPQFGDLVSSFKERSLGTGVPGQPPAAMQAAGNPFDSAPSGNPFG